MVSTQLLICIVGRSAISIKKFLDCRKDTKINISALLTSQMRQTGERNDGQNGLKLKTNNSYWNYRLCDTGSYYLLMGLYFIPLGTILNYLVVSKYLVTSINTK